MKWIIGVFFCAVCAKVMAQDAAIPGENPTAEKENETGEIDFFDPARIAPKGIRVQVEFVDMPHKTATKLLMADKSKTTDATALRMKVQELADKDGAKVLETQVSFARSNQKATVDSNHELMYPDVFTEPGFQPPKEDKGIVYANNPMISNTFSTRNIGSSLEAEPVITNNDKLIDLRLVPQLTYHTGTRVWHEGKDTAGNPFQMKMPDIYVVRLNTSLTCVDGQYFLAGMLSPKNAKGIPDHGRKVMVFVKCEILASLP